MKTNKFARKPFYVDAVRVTKNNHAEVAKWCNGTVALNEAGEFDHIKVKVYRPMAERHTQAFEGDWILDSGSGYKVYTAKAFDKSFEKVRTLSKPQADAAGIKVPHEPKASPVEKIERTLHGELSRTSWRTARSAVQDQAIKNLFRG